MGVKVQLFVSLRLNSFYGASPTLRLGPKVDQIEVSDCPTVSPMVYGHVDVVDHCRTLGWCSRSFTVEDPRGVTMLKSLVLIREGSVVLPFRGSSVFFNLCLECRKDPRYGVKVTYIFLILVGMGVYSLFCFSKFLLRLRPESKLTLYRAIRVTGLHQCPLVVVFLPCLSS